MFKLGVDLGGTKIEGIVLNDELNEVYRKRIATEQQKGYMHIINNIAALYHDMAKQINLAPHTFGIGTPGSVSKYTGLLKNSNTTCLNLENLVKRKVAIGNDANCFVLAEALKGAGRNKQMVFGVIMGTGCGGGIVYDGKLIGGLQGIAGEWGHTSIDPNGPLCYCGKRGCVETFISGGGVENRYAELTGIKIPVEELIVRYRKKEKEAEEIIGAFFKHFGIALSNVINILDPDVVVLGGGLSNIPEIYTFGINEVQKNIFNDQMETLIVKNVCGDSAGVFGAALTGV